MSRILVAMSGGRRLVGRGGAPARGGPRRRRRLDAPARRGRHVHRVQEELLLARRRRRRAPRRRPARHPVLRDEPRARVRRRRPRSRSSTRTSTAGRRARASTATRTSSSARCSAGRATCTSATRSRPATTRGGRRRRTGARGCSGPRDADKDQTYFLYGLRAGPARARPLPARRADQARGARRRARRSASRPPTSRRARRSASCPAATTATRCATRAGWRPEPGPLSTPTASGSASTAARPAYTVGQRQGLGVALGAAALRLAHRPAVEHDPARPARGPRDARVHGRAGHVRGRAPPSAAITVPCRGPHPPSRRARSRRRPAASPRRASGAGSSSPTSRSGPPRPARRPCSYDGDDVLGGGRIEVPASRPQTPVAPTRSPRSPARELEPSLVLSVLVGIFHAAASSCPRHRPAAGCRARRSPRPRRVGRRRDLRAARPRPPALGDYNLVGASIVGLAGHRHRGGDRGPGPEPGAPGRMDARVAAKFLRGLTVGAILGAVIAGSRLWRTLGRRGPRR